MATRLTIAILGMLLAIWLGFLAGEGAIVVISGFVTLIAVFILKFSVGRKLSLGSMLCIILLLGILIGQKGFTYLRFTSILFISELFLVVLLSIYICNTIIRHRSLLPNTWLARVVFLFLLYSVIHLYFDYKKYQFMALRDSCLAYYTLFFILAYRISHEEAFLRILKRCLPLTFLIIAISYVPYSTIFLFAEFLHSIRVQGNGLIMLNTDVSMNATFGAFFYFYWRFLTEKNFSYGVWGGTLLSFFAMLGAVRGTMIITCIVSICIFLYFRAHSVVRHSLVTAGIFIVSLSLVFLVDKGKIPEKIITPLILIAGEFKAMQLQILQDDNTKTTSEDNARWRVQWWKKLWADTINTAPLTGLGFGADIATPFHMEYYGVHQPEEEWSRIRGAHSALMTVFARLGLIGVLFFLLIMGSIAHRVWLTMHLLNQKRLPLWYLAPTGYIVGGFVISFFQYTWEAPYTAIPFWIMVGILYSGTDKILYQTSENGVSSILKITHPINISNPNNSPLVVSRKFQPTPLSSENLLHRRKRKRLRSFRKKLERSLE